MKVLMVISQFYPIIGGAERQAQLLAKKLIERGIEVKVVTGWWNLKTPRKEIIDGIQVFRNFSFWGMFGIKGLRVLGALSYMVSLGIYLLVHRRKYDIIHVHQVLYPAFVSVLIGKGTLRKPVLLKNSCTGLTSDIIQLRRFPTGGLQLKYLIKEMDSLVAVSQEGINEFKTIGCPEARIVYIPNGVAIPTQGKAKYGQVLRVLRVLTVARLDRQKGIDILLRAWADIISERQTRKLIIIGNGPLKRELQILSRSLGVFDSVEFTGEVKNVEVYLRDADLFILPSRAEGMPNALLEAMSYGIPCIATNVGGNVELIGMQDKTISNGEYSIGENGLLVNPDDAKGVSEAILYFIRNREAREKMGRKGRKFIEENFPMDLVADRYIALYMRMLNGRS